MFAHLACLGYIPPEDPNRKPKDEDEESCFTQVQVMIKNQDVTFLVYDNCEGCIYEHQCEEPPVCWACHRPGGLIKEFHYNRVENEADQKKKDPYALPENDTFVHMICALAFPDVFWLKNVVTMRFYCSDKKALFDAQHAHKLSYGNHDNVLLFARDNNKQCSICKQSKGKLRVTCKRMHNKIKYKETTHGEQKSGIVMQFDLKKFKAKHGLEYCSDYGHPYCLLESGEWDHQIISTVDYMDTKGMIVPLMKMEEIEANTRYTVQTKQKSWRTRDTRDGVQEFMLVVH